MEEGQALFGNTPTTFVFFPLIGILVIAACTGAYALRCYRSATKVSLSALAWSLLFSAILALLGLWCALGYVDSTETYLVQGVVVLTIGGALVATRERLFAKLDACDARSPRWRRIAFVVRLVRDAAAVFVAAEFARLALELPSNDLTYSLSSNSVIIELSFILLVMLSAYFLSQRRALGPALTVIVCYVVGLAEYFVVEFKQNAILPMELFALRTGAEVAGQYTYILNSQALRGLTCAAIALVALTFVRPAQTRLLPRRRRGVECGVNLSLALVCALGASWWVTGPDYHDDLGYTISYWNSSRSYRTQGILPSFFTALEDMPMQAPEGYDHDEATELTATYASRAEALPERSERRALSEAQYRRIKPSVVIIMNETFADLSRLDDLGCGYEGPRFFKSMSDTLRRGQLAVSVYGAGTCNTEFEVLTGNSLAFVGAGKYPYQMFDLSDTANLARQFKEQGYATTAIHPNAGDNWNRNTVYEAMGFDRFISTDNDFIGEPGFHNGFTDRVTYERILSTLASDDDPQFVFDVTMQNHGGYSIGNIPANRLTNYQPTGFTQDEVSQLNEYLSCIQASDEDLEWFVGELEALERPVVLVFFGDHHPSISNIYNDALFDPAGEDEVTHQARVYQTDYVIWANYDVAGVDQTSEEETVGTDSLAALTLDLIGAPLDEFQEAQLGVRQRLEAINLIGYQATDGRWHEALTCPYLDGAYRDMAKMDFLRFGESLV